MAIKKPAPKKNAKVLKSAQKPAATSTAKVVAKTPVKKVVPAKVVVTPPAKKAITVLAKKVVKPVAKAPAKNVADKKPVVQMATKKVVTPAKPVAKKTAKSVAKVLPKAVVKKTVSKKQVTKSVAKVAIPVKKVVTPIKPVAKVVEKPIVAPTKKMAKAKLPEVPATPAKAVKKALEPIKDVKVGKINTKTSVPYNPVYTPMEKRTNTPTHSSNPLVKYSDSDLNEFRELINKKMDTAKKELVYLQGLITRKDEGGGNDEARYMTMEDGSMSMEREQLSQMAGRQITYIDHLEKAIMRIENKTYGVCRVTGKLIDKARLRAVPHATLSLEAKLGLVKPGNE